MQLELKGEGSKNMKMRIEDKRIRNRATAELYRRGFTLRTYANMQHWFGSQYVKFRKVINGFTHDGVIEAQLKADKVWHLITWKVEKKPLKKGKGEKSSRKEKR